MGVRGVPLSLRADHQFGTIKGSPGRLPDRQAGRQVAHFGEGCWVTEHGRVSAVTHASKHRNPTFEVHAGMNVGEG